MSNLRMFIPLTKVDIEKRLVYGTATAESPDLSGETCDYASTKPYYQKWSEGVKKASGGKSLGNLRAMHGSIAAGKLMDISFDDDNRKIEVCAKVVDDGEWAKVREGVYTGFSQGGRYAKRWTDTATGESRYTAEPTEISLVDLPCLPSATFEMVKRADGIEATEKVAFKSVIEEPETDAIKAEAEALAKAAADGRAWRDFAETALTTLMKRQMSDALAKLAPDESSADTISDKATAQEPAAAKKRFEPEQVWSCGCADHKHLTKAEAVGCMRKRATEADVAVIVSPLDASLNRLEEALGGEKVEKGAPPPAKAGDMDAAKAHRDAADAHDTAADLHEGMAAKDDTSADDAKEHLDAAAAHKRAAAAHRRAADLHGKKDAGADDSSKKAGMLTANAAQKSDGMFGKSESTGALTKWSSDEARDESGKWSSGATAEHARKEATSVTHALAQSAFAMGVGHAAGHVGQKVGATVGRLAGKALALAATRNSAAAEGGAVVGEKIGSAVGQLAGRMYGEARGWAMAAGAKTDGLEKGLYSVGRLAELLEQLSGLYNCVSDEAIRENDASPVPGALKDQIKALSETLVAMAREETMELFGDGTGEGAYDAPAVLAMAAGLSSDARAALIKISEDVPGLKKVAAVLESVQGDSFNRAIDTFVTEMQALGKSGARNSAADKGRIQKAHDLLSELGADCLSKAAPSGLEDDTGEDMAKLRDENESLRKSMETTSARVDELVTKVAEMSKRAAPAKAAVRAVSKGEDTAGIPDRPEVSAEDLAKHLASMDPQSQALLLTKVALAHPVSPITGR